MTTSKRLRIACLNSYIRKASQYSDWNRKFEQFPGRTIILKTSLSADQGDEHAGSGNIIYAIVPGISDRCGKPFKQ